MQKWVLSILLGDVPTNMFNLGFGAHVRKSLGYVFSLRLEYMHGTGKGQHWQQATNYGKNPAWSNRFGFPGQYSPNVVDASGNRIPAADKIFYNYKANVNDIGLQGIFSLNNIRFHKAKTKSHFYLLGRYWYDLV